MREKKSVTIRKTASSPPRQEPSPAAAGALRGFTWKFPVAAGLFLIPLSLIPEARYEPLNRLIAVLAGEMLRLTATNPVVRGTHITLDGFSVHIIAECTGVYLFALFGAFVAAFPAGKRQKWIGLPAGVGLLFTLNLVRIAAVTLIGRTFPGLFEAAHIYLGQFGMILATVFLCLAWCRRVADPGRTEGPGGFLLRFLAFTVPAFPFWMVFNRSYMAAVDAVIDRLYAFTPYRLTLPRTHDLYYQSFSLIVLTGLLLAVKGVRPGLRLRWLVIGAGACTLFQIGFRLCNVWISAFRLAWAEPLSQVLYAACVYAVPLVFALRFIVKARMERRAN